MRRLSSIFRFLPFGMAAAARDDQWDMLTAENADLRKVVDRQAAIINDKLNETMLTDMRAGASAGGGMEVDLIGGPVGYITEYLFEVMRGGKKTGDPHNFVEAALIPRFEAEHRSGERYVLTIQRVHGLTPSEKLRAAESRADVAERALERIYAERDTAPLAEGA